MDSQEWFFNDMDRLWFFSNMLSKPTPTTQLQIPVTYLQFMNVNERVHSWLQDSVEAAMSAVEEEEYEEELEKEEEALEEELAKRLENTEQSTLIAMLMSAPSSSIKTVGSCRKRGARRRNAVKSVKNELFETKRSVLKEIQCGYFPLSMR